MRVSHVSWKSHAALKLKSSALAIAKSVLRILLLKTVMLLSYILNNKLFQALKLHALLCGS